MRTLTITDSATVLFGLQDEIRRSDESRYDHRLHGVLLVAQGMTCPEVARVLGDASRSVEYWVRGFDERGLAALREGARAGRPRRPHTDAADSIGQRAEVHAGLGHRRRRGRQSCGGSPKGTCPSLPCRPRCVRSRPADTSWNQQFLFATR